MDKRHYLSANDKRKGLKLPEEFSRELAEFFGIMAGDGYLNYYEYQSKYILEIAGDSRYDREYLEFYVRALIARLFNLSGTIYRRKDQNTLYVRVLSKGLIYFLVENGFPRGKKEQMGVPHWISENRDYMRSFVKGLADTDFSFFWRKKYPIISFGSKSQPLAEAVFRHLCDEGFRPTKIHEENRIDTRGYQSSMIYKIILNGRDRFRLWMELIGFRNDRHIQRIKMGTAEFESTS